MKVGDLVRLKPEAAEGDAKGLGVGVIVEEGADQWNQEFLTNLYQFQDLL